MKTHCGKVNGKNQFVRQNLCRYQMDSMETQIREPQGCFANEHRASLLQFSTNNNFKTADTLHEMEMGTGLRVLSRLSPKIDVLLLFMMMQTL